MTEIFCDADCKYAKEHILDDGTIDHTNCTADSINLFFAVKEGHPCTMYEKNKEE
jgi:hypothetical protein